MPDTLIPWSNTAAPSVLEFQCCSFMIHISTHITVVSPLGIMVLNIQYHIKFFLQWKLINVFQITQYYSSNSSVCPEFFRIVVLIPKNIPYSSVQWDMLNRWYQNTESFRACLNKWYPDAKKFWIFWRVCTVILKILGHVKQQVQNYQHQHTNFCNIWSSSVSWCQLHPQDFSVLFSQLFRIATLKSSPQHNACQSLSYTYSALTAQFWHLILHISVSPN